MFITVPIVCIAEDLDDAELKNIRETFERCNIAVADFQEETEIRYGDVNTEYITCYYPANDKSKTLVELAGGTNILVKLTFADFRLALLNKG